MPFIDDVLRDFAAIAWPDHDFPAGKFFDFAADSACFAWADDLAVPSPAFIIVGFVPHRLYVAVAC